MDDLFFLTFYPNGSYIHYETANPPTDTDFTGVEYGTWAFDAGTGKFTTTQAVDDNGGLGLNADTIGDTTFVFSGLLVLV